MLWVVFACLLVFLFFYIYIIISKRGSPTGFFRIRDLPHLKQGYYSRFQSNIGARFGIKRLQGMRDVAQNKHLDYGIDRGKAEFGSA